MPSGVYVRTKEPILCGPSGKRCALCREVKPLADFCVDRTQKTGLKAACRTCQSHRFRAWRWRDVQAIRRNERIKHYVRKYGISGQEAAALVANRRGRCPICTTENQLLVVDHNHSSGAVRDRICGLCNSLIGYARENIAILSAAAAYLEEHNGSL